jgi:hypothetical protein
VFAYHRVTIALATLVGGKPDRDCAGVSDRIPGFFDYLAY